MQGYILSVKKVRNEDLIVNLLGPERLETLYRFYGARHPVVTAGFKIDGEIERDDHRFLPRLRHVVHLGFSWLKDPDRLQTWQHLCTLLYEHLRGVEMPGSFYFELLERYAALWHLQNPRRAAVELYLELLEHEGRLHPPHACFVCGRALDDRITLARAYLPAHPRCVIGHPHALSDFERLVEEGRTVHLDDESVEALWLTLLEGM